MKVGPSIFSFVMEVKKAMILTMQKQLKRRSVFMESYLLLHLLRQHHQQFPHYPKNQS
jgi:hypothetical protein